MSGYELVADFVTGEKFVNGRYHIFYVDDHGYHYLACVLDARYKHRMHAEVLRTNRMDNRSEIATKLQ